MFERFEPNAIKVIMLAQEEARRLGHNFVGTEQILLGLIGEEENIAGKAIKNMGASLKAARVEMEKIIGRGSGFVSVEIPFTPRSKRVLEIADQKAKENAHERWTVNCEHLMLGILEEGDGIAIRIIEAMGIDLKKLHALITDLVSESGGRITLSSIFQHSSRIRIYPQVTHRATLQGCEHVEVTSDHPFEIVVTGKLASIQSENVNVNIKTEAGEVKEIFRNNKEEQEKNDDKS